MDDMAQFQAAQQALQALDAQMARIEEQLMELRRAHSTLDNISSSTDSLIPIGGGLHIRATVGDGPVVTPIGGGYAADMDREAALAHLDSRAKEAEQLLQQRSTEAQNLSQQLQSLAGRLQQAE